MGEQPLAAGKEGRADTTLAQNVDDAPLVAGDLVWLLAQIKRQSDQFLTRRQIDPAQHALPVIWTLHCRPRARLG